MLAVSCIHLSYVMGPATIQVTCAHNKTEPPFSNYFFTYIILFFKSHTLYPNDSKQYYYATKKKDNTSISKYKLMWNKKPFVNAITNCCFSLVPTDPVTTILSSKVNIEAQCRPLESASQLNPPC